MLSHLVHRCHLRTPVVLGLVCAISLVACSSGGSSPAASSPTTTTRSPQRQAAAPPENVAFDYERITERSDLTSLGHVSMVVTSRQSDPRAADAIHRIGASAYRYVQTYWFPARPDRDGIDLSVHPEWGFCRSGSTPVSGSRSPGGEALIYADMNERALHTFFATLFTRLRNEGWDGVFLDRGYASLTGIDTERAGIWNLVSSCTEDPVEPGATFADAYLGMAAEAHRAGLKLMFNYGVSPFDEHTPLRPDPRSPSCAVQPAPTCPRLNDGWKDTNWILDEAVTHERDTDWDADFRANFRNETDPEHGGQVVGLITDALLRGDTSRDAVYYEWSRAKLFAIPIAVGTGSGGCANAGPGTVCNRRLSFPELASTTLGAPHDGGPMASSCTPGSTTRCVWIRRYASGVVVVNAQDRPVRAEVSLGTDHCRTVTDVFAGKPVDGGKCVTTVTLDLPAWSGRPLQMR